VIGNSVTGAVLEQTQSWPIVFAIIVALYVVGEVAFVAFAKGDVIWE
jgi:hypothetical protein